jgi:protein-L-isoaspartate(D-aspartate) O-methyltransferase
MIIPVGLPYMPQQLMLLTKDTDGTTHTESVLDVAFVPLIMEEDDNNEQETS